MPSPSAGTKDADTPPSSDSEPSPRLPPSPPLSPKHRANLSPVDRLIGTLRLLRAGKLEQGADWRVFRLSWEDFEAFERRLEEDVGLRGWYEDKVRYDWEVDKKQQGQYTLRMPTKLHERFSALVEDAIVTSLAKLAERLGKSEDEYRRKAGKQLKEVYEGKSTTLELHVPPLENSSQSTATSSDAGGGADVVVRRSPDATFYHPSQDSLPTLVLEVSYSQQQKDLPRLAESYIVDSRHSIRCVVGLDITYPSSSNKQKRKVRDDEEATVSVWRPDVEKDESGEEVGVCVSDVDGVAFQHGVGEACHGSLNLKLSDFLPPDIVDTNQHAFANNEGITIPFSDLCAFLTSARARSSDPAAAHTPFSAPKKFRKRKRTPPEELSSGREEEYSQQEAAAVRKERRVDGEWRAKAATRDGSGEDGTAVVERRQSLRKRASGRSIGYGS